MIVIDSSALVAMLTDEATASSCRTVFENENLIYISAGTVLEALIVALRRGFYPQMQEILASPGMVVVPVNAARAQLAASAYAKWGKGIHPAALNSGDCFAYAMAQEFDYPLLFIGDDFSRTDIKPAVAA
ncbi:ribonuclease VapC [Neorhizobium huautlense]|uniref:Ribonuclease VapC n=1 Tax=Neorhizobium huautlense TaxID=67774 RepID=A0ABT9PNP5_9HYPH|nr:type II toxin-antitoxin system VapC family toxin [Neorhizobium huautlense]MDP9836082.1 ribonuclease VapC [Neorhizobium huautlense]